MRLFTALLLLLALAGCDYQPTPRSAYQQARDDAFDDAAAAGMIANGFSRSVSCMNIGGIVTCQ